MHRSLRAQRHGQLTEERVREWEEELPEAARHTSDRERRADEAEREIVQWKKVRFMADKVGEEFEGYVIGVAPFGLFVQLIEHFVDGLVHISSMADDYYRFIDRQHVLFGENTGKSYRLGDKVVAQVTRVDMERRQVELGLADILDVVRQSERNRGPRKQHGGVEGRDEEAGLPAGTPGAGAGQAAEAAAIETRPERGSGARAPQQRRARRPFLPSRPSRDHS